MVTKSISYDGGVNYLCLSTDTKPMANINDLLYELDTKKMFYFNGVKWCEVGTDGE